jgi:RES domain-containing protein
MTPPIDINAADFAEWTRIENHLREVNRYFPPRSAFLDSLVAECHARVTSIARAFEVFRARIVPYERFPLVEMPASELGAPAAALARQGRLNPEGIPFFYAALDPLTALAEVRPAVGAYVRIAKCSTLRELRVADLTGALSDTRDNRNEKSAWLSLLFGRPAHQEDRHPYVGTQYLAQRLRHESLDGVVYDSYLRVGGVNLAFFDPAALSVGHAMLRRVRSIDYEAVRPPGIA